MRRLLRGELSPHGYCLLLRNLHAVYEALEAALQAAAATHPPLQVLVPPTLWRAPSLQQDLLHLHGSHWRHTLPLAPAAQAYVQRLATLQAAQPEWLAAHAYVRYLGDLNGGQMLARLVAPLSHAQPPDAQLPDAHPPDAQPLDARLQPVPARHGLAFYHFEGDTPVATLQARFRLALDQQAHTEPQAQALVDEACSAFVRHRELFVELEGLLQPSAAHTPASA